MGNDHQNRTTRCRVIIADDNKEIRDIVFRLLEEEFDVVAAVADGRALVEAADKLQSEIGIVDISMPLMNGIEAAADIKKHGSLMKFVFLTVNEDPDFVRAAFDTGASGYVLKRQVASDLVVAVREALAGRTFVSASCRLPENL